MMHLKLIFTLSIFCLFSFLFSAQAQTPQPDATSSAVPVQTLMLETRDDIDSLINRMSVIDPEKYSISHDYAKAGPLWQKRFVQNILRFKKQIEILTKTSLANSIVQYNTLFKDQSLSEADQNFQLQSALTALKLQAKAANATYQSDLAQLYKIDPRITVTHGFFTDHKFNLNLTVDMEDRYFESGISTISTNLKFEDQSNAFYTRSLNENNFDSYSFSYAEFYSSELKIISQKIKKLLFKECSLPDQKPSQACISNLLADFSTYYSNIDGIINQDRPLPLKGDTRVYLEKLKFSPYTQIIIDALAHVDFNDQNFTLLPLSN